MDNEKGTMKKEHIMKAILVITAALLAINAAASEYAAYLAAYMTHDDEKHLYYAIAEGDFNFRVINNAKPVLSASFDDRLIRDPHIIRDGDAFHLVATVSWTNRPFTVWDSSDLVHWKNERLVDVAPQGATKTWAPELAYDDARNRYIVYWTGEISNKWSTASIYYAVTKDFKEFSAPEVLYKDTKGILDANIIKVGGEYNLLFRKENKVWIVSSKDICGPYSNCRLLTADNVERPYAFTLNDASGYGVVWDYYIAGRGFGLMVSEDFKTWTRITNETPPYYNKNVSFPQGIRHGVILGITAKELERLKQAFPD